MCEAPSPILSCEGPVSCLCAAPELGAVVVSDTSGAVHVLDVASGAKRYELRRGKDTVTAVAFASDVRAVISAEGSIARDTCTVVVWDADSGAIRAEINYGNFVTDLTYASEMRAVITGDGHFSQSNPSGQVVVWNVDSLEQFRKMKCGVVTRVAWHPARQAIIALDRQHCMRAWSPSGELLFEVAFDAGLTPYCLAMPCDSQQQAEGSFALGRCNFKENFSEVRIYSAEGAVQCSEQFDAAVISLAFLPGSSVVACGARNGELVLWDYEARARRRTLSLGSAINALVYNVLNGELVGGHKTGAVRCWPVDFLLSD
eukprot:TRINITY_DN50703_c0_g1_i1.p1 TRINITY_DN50703_c0_g1~~TRINITY_DN50703_c0_g1_i1.p1  ORF type:complete len:316 (-),score=56.49 TRINITY_DN50703_c0_g1_i1:12-959(-)